MRTVTAGLFVSLDGVTESPEKWQLPYFNDEIEEAVGAAMAAAEAIRAEPRSLEPGQAGGHVGDV
jgi:hypothetical protein